jgi:hypothetical protein
MAIGGSSLLHCCGSCVIATEKRVPGALSLGRNPGETGTFEQRFGAAAVDRACRDAHTGMHDQLQRANGTRSLNGLHHRFGQLRQLRSVVHTTDHARELIAPHTTDHIPSAYRPAQSGGNDMQQLVAHRGAMGIVDQLESGQIEKHHREVALTGSGTGQLLVDALQQETLIGKLGQAVVRRIMPRPALALLCSE